MEEVPLENSEARRAAITGLGEGRAVCTAPCPGPGPTNREGRWRVKGEKKQGVSPESWTPLTEGRLGRPAPECPTHLPLSPLHG